LKGGNLRLHIRQDISISGCVFGRCILMLPRPAA
jgi:hypothetical protein